MSSQTRETRGDATGLDLRTLAIASFAAAVAAIVVSRIWTAGTPIAAAATPVIVTILKEVLDRPTAKIAERMTTESAALGDTRVRPPETRATEVTPEAEHTPGDVRVYRQQGTGAGIGRRINAKVVAITAAIAFVVAGVVITGGQALAGNPFGKDGTGAIILGQHKAGKKKTTTTETGTQTTPQQTVTETTPQPDAPQQTTTTPRQQAAPEQQDRQQDQQDTTTTPTETTTTPGN